MGSGPGRRISLRPGPLCFRRYPSAMAREIRLDFSNVNPGDKLDTLTDGSIKVRANIARVGVQLYQYDDGTEVREYRPADEVFHPDSLATWGGLSLTAGHPDTPVDPGNWGQVTIGHIGDTIRTVGPYVQADAVVKDDSAIKAIASGELVEVSCGYFAEIDRTPGVTPEGEPYDQIQRAIVGNHVALGPKGWGRAGPEVRLLTDAAGSARPRIARGCLEVDYPSGMAKPNPNARNSRPRKDASEPPAEDKPADKAQTDADNGVKCPQCGAMNAEGSEACAECGASLVKDESAEPSESAPASESAPTSEPAPSAEDYARVMAERDAYKAQLEALMAQMQLAAKTEDSRVAKRVALRVQALKADSAISLLRADGTPLTDREVMLSVIRSRDSRFDAKGKDDAYIRARFDLTCEGFAPSAGPNANALAGIVANPRVDSAEGNKALEARERMIARNRELAIRKGK